MSLGHIPVRGGPPHFFFKLILNVVHSREHDRITVFADIISSSYYVPCNEFDTKFFFYIFILAPLSFLL